MATYKLTPDTGQTSGTNSSMPLLVKPSVLEMGSLTTAQANSVRFYSDSGLTTELAREVVSADEIWVKVASVSSSTEIWMDYDGVSSDYAVTDTYGRNAVWSDYAAVYHMNEDPSGTAPQIIDSTGNGNSGTSSGSMTSGDLVSSQIGNGIHFDTTNDYINVPDSASLDITSAITIQGWISVTEDGDHDFFNKFANATWTAPFVSYYLRFQTRATANADKFIFAINGGGTYRQAATANGNLDFNTNYLAHGTYDGTTLRVYRDGVEGGSTSYTGSITASSQPLVIGNNIRSAAYLDKTLDELRVRGTAVSADWISTEYNNHKDNAAFWVATEVVETSTSNPLFFGSAL